MGQKTSIINDKNLNKKNLTEINKLKMKNIFLLFY